jgi:hypothetical protein
MRIIGLLNWYDEDPEWLSDCVKSLNSFCDHLIAVDGPYAVFPGGQDKPYSDPEQVDAIRRAAGDMGLTIHAPRRPWRDNEVGKRDFMFRLGATFAEADDWYLRIDADEVFTQVPSNIRQRLAESRHAVAAVTMWTREMADWYAARRASGARIGPLSDYEQPFRCLFRALPGIRIEQAHYLVTAPIGGRRRVLRGHAGVHVEEPAEPLLDVRLEHRTHRRPPDRKQLKSAYGEVMSEIEQLTPIAE